MKLKLHSFYCLILLLSFPLVYAQTSGIKGVVIEDKTGQTLPGATVTILGTDKSRVTGADGAFAFSKVEPGAYTLKVTSMNYQEKEISEVIVVKDEIYVITVSLTDKNNQLDEVVITKTKAKAESVKSLLAQQKNSANVSDGISAETIKRTPDKNTSDVLKRISGASIQDNRFVIIRGLNDRYNAAYLNGAPLPSSESDRKAFSFDIFPANMLDNLIITKTASPDLPGEFAGGVIQINTKAVPDKDFQTISIGSGYNTITTWKNQKTYEGSSTDWLGFDNGKRDLPSTIPGTEAFNALTYQEKAVIAKSFQSDWAIKNNSFKPNTNFQYTLGRHFEFGDKVLGMLFSVSNNKTNTYDETLRNDYESPKVLVTKYNDKNYTEQILSAALANFSLKFNENHTLSFKNIYNFNAKDLVVERSGQRDVNDTRVINSDVRWFTSNKIYSGQLNGDHYFTHPKIKANWTAFYSDIKRSIPNLRRNIYSTANPNSTDPSETIAYAEIANNNGGPDYGGGMFFSENKETIKGGKVDISRKFNIGENLSNEVKMGAFFQQRDRDFFARQLQYNTLTLGGNFDYNLLTLPNETIFSQANMGQISSGVNGFTLFDFTKLTDAYTAGSKLNAGYWMLDNRYKKFRLVWGIRIEDFTQTLNSRVTLTDNLDLDKHQTDVLPSANLIFSINKKQNLRLSYSKTLNRPEFRELAPFGFYDFTNTFFTQGKDLKIAEIRNIDLRYEFYPGKGQLFSVSYFNKNFTNPIELKQEVNNKTITYDNAAGAKNSGFEFEFRTLLSSFFTSERTTVFDDITLFSNIAIIKSSVDVSNFASASPETSRPLQGQSPYVFNAGAQYVNKDNGWAFSANINRVGNRIFIAGNELKPSIWEKARTFLDMQIAKNFYKNKLEVKLNIQNILAQDLIFYQNNYNEGTSDGSSISSLTNAIFTGDSLNENGYDSDTDDLLWSTKYGRTFSLSLTYNF
jgi:outer membrane receptor protein involved in Fe transport